MTRTQQKQIAALAVLIVIEERRLADAHPEMTKDEIHAIVKQQVIEASEEQQGGI